MKNSSILASLLDEIWHSQTPQEAANDCLAKSSKKEVAIVSAWYVASLVEGNFNRVEIGEKDFSIFSNKNQAAIKCDVLDGADNTNFILYYDDILMGISCDPAYSIKISTTKQSLSNLYQILQYIRDHIDSVLMLPGNLRKERFVYLSQKFGIDVLLLQSLILNEKLIREFI
ncbi:hypothetical protein [Terasakiella pusilla]|uniref:hypothetical protein n=1 Tax=Terasakiella pusilla TaxID=64973 RepID=UPI003AA9946C